MFHPAMFVICAMLSDMCVSLIFRLCLELARPHTFNAQTAYLYIFLVGKTARAMSDAMSDRAKPDAACVGGARPATMRNGAKRNSHCKTLMRPSES